MSITPEVLEAISEEPGLNGAPDEADRPDRFRARNGVLFRLKPVPPFLIIDAQKNLKEPVPPKVPNFDKGDDVLEENVNDPEYIRALEEYRRSLGELSNAILITRGTEVLSIPDEVDKIEDTGWSDDAQEFAGIAIPDSGRRRMFCWVKYVVLTNMSDFQGLLMKISALAGLTMEEEVATATDSFRPDTPGDAAQ